MKPTVITANQTSAGGGGGAGGNGNGSPAGAGMNIPINREYGSSPQQQNYQPQYYTSQQPTAPAYGSPRQQQQQPHHQVPTNQQQHFQPTFGFEPDMDMDMDNMFPRSRLAGRMHHDPFAGFGGTHFGFPQLRRNRATGGANNHMEADDDFFNRLPSEFRQYIPEHFGARRTAGVPSQQQPQPQQHAQQQHHPQQQQHPHPHPQQQYYQQDYQQAAPPQAAAQVHPVTQSPSKRLCDAAIQTEDPAGRSEVDCAPPVNLNQHGLRNTMDMGIKSAAEQDQASRSHSAPPPEQQQLNQQYQQQQRPTAPPAQFGTQTSPPVQQQQMPQFHKTFYPPQQQSHPQQKQQTPPPPQTPGGSYVRTIPIFVEGRTEPIINAHKEIPNQNAGGAPQAQASAQASAHAQAQPQAFYGQQPGQASYMPPQQQHQQQQRPAPLNTQQQQEDANVGVPPQTPHTVDSIKKIQDIQRDVLELMGKVEQFKGTRQDKEYVYLDEMLTRNLLKLDTIDTNGKDSIRLARKEAIKCIQASVNVLDAKAEENARMASGADSNAVAETENKSTDQDEPAAVAEPSTPQPLDATKIQEPIPLPPPPSAVESATEASSDATVQGSTTTTTETSE